MHLRTDSKAQGWLQQDKAEHKAKHTKKSVLLSPLIIREKVTHV